MKNVVLYIAMSLDGYVADAQGGVAWLAGDGSEPDAAGTYLEFYESVDAIILGYKTYEQIITELAVDAWPYDGKDCYVLTHREGLEDIIEGEKRVYFRSQSVRDLIASLPEDTGTIWLCGGAQIAQQAVASDLIDEYRLSMIPCILGKGTSLFGDSDMPTELRLTGTSHANGIAELCYKRR